MKPININVLNTDVTITNLEVLEDGKTLEIDFDWDGRISSVDIKREVEKFVLNALERRCQEELSN